MILTTWNPWGNQAGGVGVDQNCWVVWYGCWYILFVVFSFCCWSCWFL